ncbi:MAG: toxin-antitoxin system YwqK family antitoxin [Bacteroidia bacterium]|nr:toxin-antitoxin system YwqK family antitoxin [Bacteroidia bacterium]
MKNYITCLLILLVCHSSAELSAQTYKVFKGDTINRLDKNKSKQGLWRKYYATDTLFSEGVYKDNIPVDTFRTYHKNSALQAKLIYRGKTEVCDAQVFSQDGILIAKGKYVRQAKDSVWVYYNEKSELTGTDSFSNGKKDGLSIVYYPNGMISRSVTYDNDVMTGDYKEFFDSGTPKIEAVMFGGEFVGEARVYHPNGKIWQKGKYHNGLKNGDWIILKENGEPEKTEKYDMGKLLNPSTEEQ